MFDFVLLNTLFILFPILCYLLYTVYENVIGKNNNLFFDFAIISSLYLITKYSLVFDYATDIVKILLIICMTKNKWNLSIIISLYLSIYLGIINNYNLILILLEYIIQVSLFMHIFKNVDYKYRIIIFTIIEIICGISFGYKNIYYIFIINSLYSFISYILILLIEKEEKVIDVYGTVRLIEYEKDFRESLFKVTHEIKNPLAVCKGYLDMLDINNIAKVNKYIPIIKEEIDRTLCLMNDFSNLNKLKLIKNNMDISLLLEDISDEVEMILMGRNINYIFEEEKEEIYIYGDYDRLKQVFINLIKNSIESIDKDIGFIKLKLEVKKNIIITLEDNGSGIKKEILKRIGEPFFTTKEKGTGLGIKLSTEIIEGHNGTIKYYSKEKIGTTVKIKLPKKR